MKAVDALDIALTTDIYEALAEQYVEDGWPIHTKRANFKSLTDGVSRLSGSSLAGSTVLDVGCGTGDFFPFCEEGGVTYYQGIDINGLSLQRAREKYPMGNFTYADIIRGDIPLVFDFIFASGTMTLQQQSTDNYSFLAALVGSMWNRTRKGLAFNFLTDENVYTSEPQEELFFFYNVNLVREICGEIAPDALVLATDAPIMGISEVNAQTNIFMIPKILSQK